MADSIQKRSLSDHLEAICFANRRMAFVSGPRQCGKTTLARALLAKRHKGAYFNWDDLEFRRIWTKTPSTTIPTRAHLINMDRARRRAAGSTARSDDQSVKPLVIYDEIHKAKLWKRTLKGLYDVHTEAGQTADLLVTGSARLNVYRKGSDSLMGRYHHFRLHPFTLGEILHEPASNPMELLVAIQERIKPQNAASGDALAGMLQFGGFPEPFLAQQQERWRLWRRERIERVIREDLRDLSRLPELSQIEMLVALLPERCGSQLSVQALREDLEVAHDTVRRWLDYLKELYYCYELKPWTRSVRRSLRKEGKLYLWDYSEVSADGPRFENLVAAHILKAAHTWTDTGQADAELYYLRDKDKREIDFLLVAEGRPLLPIEVKLQEQEPSTAWGKFLSDLGCPWGLQILRKTGIWRVHRISGSTQTSVLVASANEVLPYFA